MTPDSNYAFISIEGVGTDPGTVKVIDLQSLNAVATIDVPQHAAGIDFWRTETPLPKLYGAARHTVFAVLPYTELRRTVFAANPGEQAKLLQNCLTQRKTVSDS